MSNAFETFAEATKPAFMARRQRNIEQRRKDDAALRKIGNLKKKETIEEIVAGPHGALVTALRSELRRLTIDDADRLIAYVEVSGLARAPREIRYVALGLVSKAITRVRLNAGLVPFDDPLPDEPDHLFQIIKSHLGVL